MKTLFLVLLLIVSCQQPSQVKIIIPDDFSGVIRVSEDKHGKDIILKDNCYVYKLGSELHVKFKDIKHLKYISLLRVETESGKAIIAWPPNNPDLNFHSLGITHDGNIHYGIFDAKYLKKVQDSRQYYFDIEKFNSNIFKELPLSDTKKRVLD